MRILLLGKNGQVGWELQRALAPLGDIIALDQPDVDFTDLQGLSGIVRDRKPNLIVNAAAYTAVDRAESEPELAMTVNGIAPGALAEEAVRLNAGMVHYSTDYVFDGTKGEPYTEEDEPNPLNVYGQTKLAGDRAIEAVGGDYLILRTSWVYGVRGKNFFLTMLQLAREKEEARVVDDQVGCPTWSRSIADVTSKILKVVLHPEKGNFNRSEEFFTGIYNYSSSGSTSWHGFAQEIIQSDPLRHEHVIQKITPISSEEFGVAATRPKVTILSNGKVEAEFGVRSEDWRDQLAACSGEYYKVSQ